MKNRKISKITECLLNAVFPPRCPVCDEILLPEKILIHPKCKALLTMVGNDTCLRCGKQLISERNEFCFDCSHKKNKLNKEISFKQGKAIFVYKGLMKEVIYRYKYANRRDYTDFFVREAMKYRDWIESKHIECIVPVPMHRSKQRKRGYNQAESFARGLSRELGIPVRTDLVKRIKKTEALKTQNEVQRRESLRGAFMVPEKAGIHNILLVDDIYTTGSTADEISKVLKCAGAKEIYLLNICIGRDRS